MKDEISILYFADSWTYSIKAKRLRYCIAEKIMSFLIFYPVFGVFIGYYSQNYICMLGGMIALIAVILMSMCIKTINNFYLKVVSQAAIPAAGVMFIYFFYDNLIVRYVIMVYFIAAIAMYFVGICQKEAKIKNFSYIVCGEVYLIFTYIFAKSIEIYQMQIVIIISALLLAVLSIYYVSSTRIEHLINEEKQYTYNAVNKVFKMNKLLAAVLSFGMLIVFTGFHFIISAAGIEDKLAKAINMQNYNTAFMNKLIKTDMKLNGGTKNAQAVKFKNVPANQQAANITNMFCTVIICLIAGIALIFIIRKLISMYNNFIVNFNNDVNQKSERVKTEEDKHESIINSITSGLFNFNLSNRQKLRKEYFKFVSIFSSRKAKINKSDSPFQIDEKINEVINQDINDITILYEKARYSKEQITSDELKTMKELIKTKKKV